jgi:antitoxin ParD1/3/4
MTVAKPRSFTLAAEQAQYIDDLVASGRFATDSEVIAAGLESLRDEEDEIERWLREEVVPVANEMERDPSRGIPAAEVFAELKARISKR